MHDNTLTNDNRDKFSYLAGRYGQFVKFYNVEELCADKIAEIDKLFPKVNRTRFTMGMFYRFFIPELLLPEIEKAVYLDADIIVNLDINKLWQTDLGDKIMGVVTHKDIGALNSAKNFPLCLNGLVSTEDYFNSGVLLMNLKLLLKESTTLLAGLKFVAEHPEYKFQDQDALNYCFSKNTLKLPGKFNSYAAVARRRRETIPKERIYHYNGNLITSTMTLNMNDGLNHLWMSYFIKTPWFDASTIGRLFENFIQLRTRLKNSAIKVSASVSGKTRAFFLDPIKIEPLKEKFSIRADEMIIAAENKESVKKLIDAMKNSSGKVIFFIMTETFQKKKFPFDLLIKEGFVENKDFIKGWKLLDTSLNSYPFIKAM